MLFSFSSDLSPIYFGNTQSKYHTQFFDHLMSRAVSLLDIEPESVSILNEKRYTVQGMIFSLFPEYQIIGQDENGDAVYGEPDDDEPISFAKKIYLNINTLELSSEDSFSWPQYFGVLALMETNHYIIQNDWFFEEMAEPPPHIENWEEVIVNTRIRTLLSISETICFGESLVQGNTPTQGLLKDKISKQAQQAVLKRHQPLNNLKNLFVEFYFDSQDKTNKSELARKFYRSLPEQQQKVVCSTLDIRNACRTLINHLNKFLNNTPFNPYS